GGGNILSYRLLAQHLGADQPVWGLQAQGLDRNQAPSGSIEDMAALYLKVIRAQQPEGPYYMGGHSLGALIAFEMAQRLHSQGQRVALLLVLDHPGPGAKVGWKDWLHWHLICLSQLGIRDKVAYLSKRLTWRIRRGRWVPKF